MSFATEDSAKGLAFRFNCFPDVDLVGNCSRYVYVDLPPLPMHRSLACLLSCNTLWDSLPFPDALRFPNVFSIEFLPPHYSLLQ